MRVVPIVLAVCIVCSYGSCEELFVTKKTLSRFNSLKDRNVVEKISSVEKLIEMGVGYHPLLKSSKASIAGAQSQVESAKWGYFPSPSLDFSQSRLNKAITFRLDQPLWAGGRISATYDLALSRKNESLYSFSENEYMIIDTLLLTLQNYLQSQGAIDTLTQGKKELVVFRDMLMRRVDAGVSSLADLKLIQSRLAQMEADLAAAKIKNKTSLSQLEILIGSSFECHVSVNQKKLPADGSSFDVMVNSLIETHPTLKKYEAQIASAKAEKTIASSVLCPTITARAEHQNGSIYTENGTGVNNIGYIVIQMQPGAGLSSLSAIQNAEAKVMQSHFQFDAKKDELVGNLLKIYNENQSSALRIEEIENSIEATENVLDSNMRLFVAGKRQWLDVVNTSRELTQYKLQLSDIHVSRFITSYQIALQQGIMKYKEIK